MRASVVAIVLAAGATAGATVGCGADSAPIDARLTCVVEGHGIVASIVSDRDAGSSLRVSLAEAGDPATTLTMRRQETDRGRTRYVARIRAGRSAARADRCTARLDGTTLRGPMLQSACDCARRHSTAGSRR